MVMNTGTTGYMNLDLYALTYRNGKLLECSIRTYERECVHPLRITTRSRHLGAQDRRVGSWDPDELISINYKDGTFHPGDVVTFEVYDVVTNQIISRHTYTA